MSSESDNTIEQSYPEPGIFRVSARTALVLLIFTLVFTAFMAGTYSATKPLVDASAQAEKLRLIGDVLSPDSYDNDLLKDTIVLPALAELGLTKPTTLYRARKDGQVVALVAEAAASDGYSGNISLILALAASEKLIAVRVTQHKETPGLGDYIDPKKDRNKRNPWINQFRDIGFASVPVAQWRVKKDGGHFDQMTGATISARAVTNATRRAMEWLLPRQAELFALPSGATYAVAATTGEKP